MVTHRRRWPGRCGRLSPPARWASTWRMEPAIRRIRWRSIAAQVAKIRAAREVAVAAGVPLVLNARTDVYWAAVGTADGRFAMAVERLRAYRAAGADCLFVPGIVDATTIGRLVRAVQLPINVLAAEGTPPVAELGRLGVRRVSVGSAPLRATLGLVRRIADELLLQGTYSQMTTGGLAYAEVNRLLAERA